MKNFSHSKSPLKAKLSGNILTLGSWLTIPHQSVVEILATAGFEWIVIDMEHSAIDYKEMQNLIGHIQGNGMEALVRVTKNEEVVIKHAMDAGANGVIIPMITTKAEAENAVSYVKYPTSGRRGVGLSRAQHYGIGFDSYKQWLENEVVIIFQIEDIQAVNNLDEILTTNHLDGIIVGPYDLSASMNKPGDFDDLEVLQALEIVKERTVSVNKSLGFHVISSDHQKVLDKIAENYSFLAFSLDFFFMGDKARDEMVKLQKAVINKG
jgi:2-keto-3-deoxy-L-rhamnonate aldolase RhmA